MAKDNNLTDFLTDIANTIRQKKFTHDLINPQDFSKEIASLQNSGDDVQVNQSKNITITKNGTTSVTPDSDYTALSEVNIYVNVESSDADSNDSPFSWDWTQIGYTLENTTLQQQFEDDIAYSKSLMETYISSQIGTHFKKDKRLRFFPMIDTSDVTDMTSMCEECTALSVIPKLNTTNVSNMYRMFMNCKTLTTIPQLDTSSVTNMGMMFNGCEILTTIPQLDTRNVTDMDSMFYYCRKLVNIPQLDASSVTDMDSMFYYCSSLTTIPQLDTRWVQRMSTMFYYCSSLTTIPQLDTRNVTDMYRMFVGCTALTTIPQLNVGNITKTFGNLFSGCQNLTFALVINIGKSEVDSYDFTEARNWGSGSTENLQSLVDSLVVYSYDRVANGMTKATIFLNSSTNSRLTSNEIAQISAKGFTITIIN